MTEQRTKVSAEPPRDCDVGRDTPRVDALIAKVMADFPAHTAAAEARYYDEVHQHLAPLARELERENARLRKLLQQALTDAQAQEVLFEWWHLLECETAHNA